MNKLVVLCGGARLDAFIASNTEYSRSHIKKLTDDGLVLVDTEFKEQKGRRW